MIKNFGIIDKGIGETNRGDGPIEGVTEVNGKWYYLEMIDQDEVRNRAFTVYDPPWGMGNILNVEHFLFQKYVGMYTTFEDGKRMKGEVKDTLGYYFNELRSELTMKDEWKVGVCFEYIDYHLYEGCRKRGLN